MLKDASFYYHYPEYTFLQMYMHASSLSTCTQLMHATEVALMNAPKCTMA